jgi:undecaprenyl pyrophosphate phosphatase UppP
MTEDKAMVCPFCGWTNEAGEYQMLLVRFGCHWSVVLQYRQKVLTSVSIWKLNTRKEKRRL